jgi:hypothetical protein
MNYRKIRLFYRQHRPDYFGLLVVLLTILGAAIAGRDDMVVH